MKNIWKHKKFKGKKFEMFRPWQIGTGRFWKLVYRGPRGGIITDEYFSCQDAKAAGWRKCK